MRALTFRYISFGKYGQVHKDELTTLAEDTVNSVTFSWLAAAFGITTTSQVSLRAAGCIRVLAPEEVEEQTFAPHTPGTSPRPEPGKFPTSKYILPYC